MGFVEAAILRTLIYSDFFNYPLTRDELWYFLASPKPVSREYFIRACRKKSFWNEEHGYFYLSGRRKILWMRKKRERISKEKILTAEKTAILLSSIPTVSFIGISGSLALYHADEDDDIDFFIITKKHTFWITRLMCLFFLQRHGLRRRYGKKTEANTVCINMIISEDRMSFNSSRQDIYTAREIVQMRPLFSRDNTYERFLIANTWTQSFLPNALPIHELKEHKQYKNTFSYRLSVISYKFLEPFAKLFQIWYMKKHRTVEDVRDGFAAFHPRDYRKEIMKRYETLCTNYKI